MLTIVAAAGGPFLAVGLARAARRAASVDRTRRLTARGRWRLPARARRSLAVALERAAVALEPEQAIELAVAAAAVVGCATFALAPPLALPAVGVALAAGPAGLWSARSRRERRLVAALPEMLERVASELRGGGTVDQAVTALADADGPVGPDLARLRGRVRLGASLDDALAAWAREQPLPAVRAVAGALAVAVTVGGRGADALDGLAASLRDRQAAVAEARALSAQARLSAWVVGAAPLVFLAFSTSVDPRSLHVLVDSAPGRVCLVVGLGLEALGALWIRRIVGTEH